MNWSQFVFAALIGVAMACFASYILRRGMVPWRWFFSCKECGRPHQFRWECPDPSHVGQTDDGIGDCQHRDSDTGLLSCVGGTWDDPIDHHVYDPHAPFHPMLQIKAEYDNR